MIIIIHILINCELHIDILPRLLLFLEIYLCNNLPVRIA